MMTNYKKRRGWFGESTRHREAAIKGQLTKHAKLSRTDVKDRIDMVELFDLPKRISKAERRKDYAKALHTAGFSKKDANRFSRIDIQEGLIYSKKRGGYVGEITKKEPNELRRRTLPPSTGLELPISYPMD